jgi:hypothetical protein
VDLAEASFRRFFVLCERRVVPHQISTATSAGIHPPLPWLLDKPRQHV